MADKSLAQETANQWRLDGWRLVLIDLDGTLWLADAAYIHATRGRWNGSSPIADELLAAGIGLTQWIEITSRLHSLVVVASVAIETLHRFRAAGRKVGCVTNLPRWVAYPLLQRLSLTTCFDVMVFNDYGLPAKPSAGPVLRAIEAACCPPLDQVLFVGDSDDDRESALAASVAFAPVIWDLRTDAEWRVGQVVPKEPDC